MTDNKVITGFDVYFEILSLQDKLNNPFISVEEVKILTQNIQEKQLSFDKQLKKLINYIYAKEFVNCVPIAEFHDFCRDKFRKRMIEDPVFDRDKCRSFATYLHTIFRNEATRVKKKFGKVHSFLDYFSDKEKQEINYKSNDDIIDFINQLRIMGVKNIQSEVLESDIHIRFLTPLTFAFYWLKNSGRL
jgi:hypothetical protein